VGIVSYRATVNKDGAVEKGRAVQTLIKTNQARSGSWAVVQTLIKPTKRGQEGGKRLNSDHNLQGPERAPVGSFSWYFNWSLEPAGVRSGSAW